MRFLAGLCLLASCSAPAPIPTDSQLAIKGGQNVSVTDPIFSHTVAVGDTSRPYCSGTLIAPDMVLTAAHCVTDDVLKPFTATGDVRVYFNGGKTVGIVAQGWHGGYLPDATVADGPTPPPNDLAILKLAQPLPAPMKPVLLADRPVVGGELVTLAGYGTTNNRSGMSPTSLRKVSVPVTFVDVDKKRIDTNNPTINNKKGACAGDSGGSIFVVEGGVTHLYGALSIGTTLQGGGCGGWNSYTNIYDYIDRVDTWMIEMRVTADEYIQLTP